MNRLEARLDQLDKSGWVYECSQRDWQVAHPAALELFLEWENRRREARGSQPPPHQLGDLGKRCKLPQWGPQRSPGRQRVFLYSMLSDCLSQHLSKWWIQFAWLGIRWVRTDICEIWVIIITLVKLDFKEVDEYSSWSEPRTVITTWFSDVVLIRAQRAATARSGERLWCVNWREGIIGRYTTFVYGKMTPGADLWTREGLRRRWTSWRCLGR